MDKYRIDRPYYDNRLISFNDYPTDRLEVGSWLYTSDVPPSLSDKVPTLKSNDYEKAFSSLSRLDEIEPTSEGVLYHTSTYRHTIKPQELLSKGDLDLLDVRVETFFLQSGGNNLNPVHVAKDSRHIVGVWSSPIILYDGGKVDDYLKQLSNEYFTVETMLRLRITLNLFPLSLLNIFDGSYLKCLSVTDDHKKSLSVSAWSIGDMKVGYRVREEEPVELLVGALGEYRDMSKETEKGGVQLYLNTINEVYEGRVIEYLCTTKVAGTDHWYKIPIDACPVQRVDTDKKYSVEPIEIDNRVVTERNIVEYMSDMLRDINKESTDRLRQSFLTPIGREEVYVPDRPIDKVSTEGELLDYLTSCNIPSEYCKGLFKVLTGKDIVEAEILKGHLHSYSVEAPKLDYNSILAYKDVETPEAYEDDLSCFILSPASVAVGEALIVVAEGFDKLLDEELFSNVIDTTVRYDSDNKPYFLLRKPELFIKFVMTIANDKSRTITFRSLIDQVKILPNKKGLKVMLTETITEGIVNKL